MAKSKAQNNIMLAGTLIATIPFIVGFIVGFDLDTKPVFSQVICDWVLIFGNSLVLLYALIGFKLKKNLIGKLAITLSILALVLRLALRIWGYLAFGI